MAEIDDSLYSRQRYVLGDSAMRRMARCNVFISGVGGLGVEIAKDVILAGVRSVTVHDTQQACTADLGTNFFLRQKDTEDGGANRATACLPHLAELNPYVLVSSSTTPLTADNLQALDEFQCVVLTDAPLSLAKAVDVYCRTHSPPIMFISGAVRGVFGQVFCDFGDQFEVVDYNDEEPVEGFVGNITKAERGVVSCLENHLHGLSSGMWVSFREINGMTALNGTRQQVEEISGNQFSIGDTRGAEFEEYQHGGVFQEVKMPFTQAFQSLEAQLAKPDCTTPDFSKPEAPLQIHVAMQALDRFVSDNDRLPAAWSSTDSEKLIELARSVCAGNSELESSIDEDLLRDVAYTSVGCFAPLCASIGGFMAQQVLTCVSGKFTPLKQMLYIDAREVLPQPRPAADQSSAFASLCGDRYDQLRVCVGSDVVDKLSNVRLFMVGCGAIGCEMMKNYALLGVGRATDGLITVTDNDLIEKSNLNRQFLFRPRHIQKAKSTMAAAATLEINPDLRIDAQQQKVGAETERTHYPDEFFQRQDLCVNALDNVEARRYMDSRCVTNTRALLESGTLGAKGHTQVIVPYLTESFSSREDPPAKEVPYCTLKSFPATIEHTIQWARDKFENVFSQKPNMFVRFWEVNKSPESVLQLLQGNSCPEHAVQAIGLLSGRPDSWEDCVHHARKKFEKLFNHAAKDLLHAFPVDTLMKDGSLFWQSPKRPPTPLIFDMDNEEHMQFITSYAYLKAQVCGIKLSDADLELDTVRSLLGTATVPEYAPSNKKIETDEKAAAPKEVEVDDDVVQKRTKVLAEILSRGPLPKETLCLFPESFEKDDDSNRHIDFITAASNLRAQMYSIAGVDRLKTKRIAGRIVPAIATTTAVVAGMVTVELVKVVMKLALESYRNCFMNLAMPFIIYTEPSPPPKNIIMKDVFTTLWDVWKIRGSSKTTLQEFIDQVKAKFGIEPATVVHGVKMIYVPVMPGHKKRLSQPVEKYVKRTGDEEYADLTVGFTNEDGGDVHGPPVRYYF